ncbi:hypothetical protein EKO04_011135 [Ascochyta lentis]|uniref:DUF4267 domain-containing protein n=1 Tax=Ascochyta lentis TaxID=205686 RepID=A0A8H7MF21_9PLEO|nr:hypothetical protein EKO04_011135 [Ascochyta lentis]
MSTPQKRLFHLFIPAFLLSTGLLGLLSPTTLASLFQMPVAPSTHAAGFVQCMGGRNLTFGLISAVFVRRGDWGAAATMAGFLAVDGVVDGWVAWGYAGFGAAVPHFLAAAGVPFLAVWMAE